MRVTHLAACHDDATYIQTAHPRCVDLISSQPCHGSRASALWSVLANLSTAVGCLSVGDIWVTILLTVATVWMVLAAVTSSYAYASLAHMREAFSLTYRVAIKGSILMCLLSVS